MLATGPVNSSPGRNADARSRKYRFAVCSRPRPASPAVTHHAHPTESLVSEPSAESPNPSPANDSSGEWIRFHNCRWRCLRSTRCTLAANQYRSRVSRCGMIADWTASVTAFASPAHTCSLDWCRHGLNDTTSGLVVGGFRAAGPVAADPVPAGPVSAGGRYSMRSARNTVSLRPGGAAVAGVGIRFLTSSSTVLLPEPQVPSTVITTGPSSSPGRSRPVSASTRVPRSSRSSCATRSLNPRVDTGPMRGTGGSNGFQICTLPSSSPEAMRGLPSGPT